MDDAVRCRQAIRPDRPASLSRGKVLAVVIGGAVAVLVLVAVSGSIAAQRLAAKESVYDAARSTGVLADAVVQPALRDDLASGDPAAFAAMDRAVRDHVLGPTIIRVKIWTPEGRIVYSDEPRLIGRVYPLEAEEREVFTHPATRGEVSDLVPSGECLRAWQGQAARGVPPGVDPVRRPAAHGGVRAL